MIYICRNYLFIHSDFSISLFSYNIVNKHALDSSSLLLVVS